MSLSPAARDTMMPSTADALPGLGLVDAPSTRDLDTAAAFDVEAVPELDFHASGSPWLSLNETDEMLLAARLPLAVCSGEDMPEVEDLDANPHEAAVIGIEVAMLYRFLSDMDPLQSKVVRLRWGLGGEARHSMEQIGTRVGVSRATARRLHSSALAELRHRFGAQASLHRRL